MAYTYAVLQVSAATFREIQTKLEEAGYHHAFKEGDDGQFVIDLHGVALRDGDAELVDDEPVIGSPLVRPSTGPDKNGRSS